ncbi:helix-turn-helix domain-containing protein [Massilia sp. CCM 9210]|uniref:helix-turn-helix domain-containing protein n=1 Tax=Massilia scottii TaxID=3057166 RepID=UPI002796A8E9|nr:helix-turn-helix domain-containing protein [Massilia sp. CCM 9210]MDQ1816250.1 helix-turn-helix domain-containing protein [Massilia sp. CCM 9210]
MDKPDTTPATPKGVIDPLGMARRIRLATYPPSAPLAHFVDYFWIVEWNMGERAPEIQRVLPYPNAHLVFERGQSAIHGVVRGAFERSVAGAGRVLGVRFKPGGLRPFIAHPVSRLADRTMPFDEVLRMPTAAAEQRVLDGASDADMVGAAEAMLLAVLPASDPRALLAEQAVNAAAAVDGPASVAALCAQVGIEERALQRLFSNYVGVSPKWVIQRYRLQEASWRLARPAPADLAALASDLGFFDQAHFTRDFTRLVGTSPLEYWKSQQAPRQSGP